MCHFVHADDYGLSSGISAGILACLDQGTLNSTSIVANGYAFEFAIDEYQRRRHMGRPFRLAAHLNLCEGPPVCPPEQVPLLVNERGHLCQSFAQVWARYVRSSSIQRQALRRQVKDESRAQIVKIQRAAGTDWAMEIDSHQHLHLVPFIQSVVRELTDELPIRYVRVPSESFFVSLSRPGALANYVGPNLIKHVLLARLSVRLRQLFADTSVRLTDHFVGVLFTGNMSLAATRRALAKVDTMRRDEIIEVLFHPGRAEAAERPYWAGRQRLANYYFSSWRTKEAAALHELAQVGLLPLAVSSAVPSRG